MNIEDINKHYITFYIPKQSGKKRKIEAPDNFLKQKRNTVDTHRLLALHAN